MISQLQYTKNPTISDYILIYLAFAFSTTSFFQNDRLKLIIFISIVAIVYFNSKRRLIFNKNLQLITVFFIAIFIIQSLFFGKINFQAIILTILSYIFLPYFLLSLTQKVFIKTYINIIYFFSITSLLFWFFSNMSPTFNNFISTIPKDYNTDALKDNFKMFIIYSYETAKVYNIIRNPGPTWEPGGWAVYLTIALIFNLLKNKTLINIKNIFFILNLITTFSTTAYLATSILVIFFIFYSKKINLPLKILIVPLFLIFFIFLFTNAEFMQDKIQQHVSEEGSKDIKESRSGRLFSFRKALVIYSKYPITGRGLVSATTAEEGQEEGSGYGIVDIGSRFGLIGLIMYLIYFFKSVKILSENSVLNNKRLTLILFIVLLIHSLSQTVYSSPILLMIFYIYPLRIVPNVRN